MSEEDARNNKHDAKAERSKDRTLSMDLSAIAGHATSEYGLSPEEIANAYRETADSIENNRILISLYHNANTKNSDK